MHCAKTPGTKPLELLKFLRVPTAAHGGRQLGGEGAAFIGGGG
jgi:hypothetical protein